MTRYKARDVDRVLVGKFGFEKHDTHHHVYRLWLDGQLVARTFISHGERELGAFLADKMARQMQLRISEFDDAINCPLSQEAYYQILRQRLSG
jgi:hypothetical protein